MTAHAEHRRLRPVIEAPLGYLIIDRPEKRNALTLEMWQALPGVVQRLADDEAVNVIVIRGAGEESFAAGVDINELVEHAVDAEQASGVMRLVQAAESAVAGCPKPVIAMIFGTCIGGGLEIAMACDIRFTAASARFGAPPARLGVVYSLSSTRRLIELVGAARARDLLFSGRTIDAAEAASMRLVERVVRDVDLQPETVEYAHTISRRSQTSVRAAKEIVRAVLDGAREESDDLHRLRVESLLGEDFREGAAAFREGRPPHFPSSTTGSSQLEGDDSGDSA